LTFHIGSGKNSLEIEKKGKKVKNPSGEQERRIPQTDRCHVTRININPVFLVNCLHGLPVNFSSADFLNNAYGTFSVVWTGPDETVLTIFFSAWEGKALFDLSSAGRLKNTFAVPRESGSGMDSDRRTDGSLTLSRFLSDSIK